MGLLLQAWGHINSNALGGFDWLAWPSIPSFNDTISRHNIDLPNVFFRDGHAHPFYFPDLRDPENWAIEGWNQNCRHAACPRPEAFVLRIRDRKILTSSSRNRAVHW